MAIQDQWRRVIAAQIEEKPGTQIGQIGKTENRIGYQIRKPVSIFRENRKPKAKTENAQTAMNTKTEKPI